MTSKRLIVYVSHMVNSHRLDIVLLLNWQVVNNVRDIRLCRSLVASSNPTISVQHQRLSCSVAWGNPNRHGLIKLWKMITTGPVIQQSPSSSLMKGSRVPSGRCEALWLRHLDWTRNQHHRAMIIGIWGTSVTVRRQEGFRWEDLSTPWGSDPWSICCFNVCNLCMNN